jgi:hypothetical protein
LDKELNFERIKVQMLMVPEQKKIEDVEEKQRTLQTFTSIVHLSRGKMENKEKNEEASGGDGEHSLRTHTQH